MAICWVIDAAGVTVEQYERMVGLALHEGRWPEGQLDHIAGPVEGGWRVVDVFESQEAFDRFFEAQLGPALRAADYPEVQVTRFPVHKMKLP